MPRFQWQIKFVENSGARQSTTVKYVEKIKPGVGCKTNPLIFNSHGYS